MKHFYRDGSILFQDNLAPIQGTINDLINMYVLGDHQNTI